MIRFALRTRSGNGLRRSYLAKSVTPAAVGVTTGCLSKPFFELRAPVRRGGLCRKPLASGSRSICVSGDRRRRESGSALSRLSAMIPTSSMSSSTVHSSWSTSMAPRRRGSQNQAIGRSRDGLTTKIMALVDALGDLVRFVLLPGQRHDSIGVEPLVPGLDSAALVGDKAFDKTGCAPT